MEQEFRRCMHEAHENGQTVFLSSHILSEVEALCDRVGILREGRLAEIGTLEELRHLTRLRVEVIFETDEVPELDGVSGVHGTRREGRRVFLEVQGSMQPLLAALRHVPVQALLSREPSLEELFPACYCPVRARQRGRASGSRGSSDACRGGVIGDGHGYAYRATFRRRLRCHRPAAHVGGRDADRQERAAFGWLVGHRVRFVADGHLSASEDPADLAEYVSTVSAGLAVQAAGGVGRDELRRVVDRALLAFPKRTTRTSSLQNADQKPQATGAE